MYTLECMGVYEDHMFLCFLAKARRKRLKRQNKETQATEIIIIFERKIGFHALFCLESFKAAEVRNSGGSPKYGKNLPSKPTCTKNGNFFFSPDDYSASSDKVSAE